MSRSREAQGALELLPVSHPEAAVIEAGVIDVVRLFGRPGGDIHGEVVSHHHRFAVEEVGAAGDGHAQAIDLQPVQPLQAVVDDPVVLPSHQPVRGGAVEEVVLARALPDEVPRILRIDADGAATVAVVGMKRAREVFLENALPVPHGIAIVARLGRHEADAVYAAVLGVAEAFHLPLVAPVRSFERSRQGGVDKRIGGVGTGHAGRDLHEVISVDRARGLSELNVAGSSASRGRQRRGDPETGNHEPFISSGAFAGEGRHHSSHRQPDSYHIPVFKIVKRCGRGPGGSAKPWTAAFPL